MRKTISFVLLTFCLVLPLFAKRSHVELSGKDGHPIKRSLESVPVKAFIDDEVNELYLEFTSDMGMVAVTVSGGEGNIAYTDYIDGVSSVIIALDKELQGEFTLSISNADIELSGHFFINH